MGNLDNAFRNFSNSDDARKPVFDVDPQWRAKQKAAAIENGDLAADKNPDTSLEDGYWDATFEEQENYEFDEDGNPRGSW